MSDKLYEHLEVDNLAQLQNANSDIGLKCTEGELLTLIALKLLMDHYSANQKVWKLVDKKARKALMQSMAIDNLKLNVALSKVNTCFRREKWDK